MVLEPKCIKRVLPDDKLRCNLTIIVSLWYNSLPGTIHANHTGIGPDEWFYLVGSGLWWGVVLGIVVPGGQ